MDIAKSILIDNAEMAYHLLCHGYTVHEAKAVGDGRIDARIKRIKGSHPALGLEYEVGKDGAHYYCLTPEASKAVAFASSYYTGEELPEGVKHELTMKGLSINAVTRDAYYITETVTDEHTLQVLLLLFAEKISKVKAYPAMVGLDIYYRDGNHVSYSLNSVNGDNIGGRIAEMSCYVEGSDLLWKVDRSVKKTPLEGIAKVRGMYFGNLIMM